MMTAHTSRPSTMMTRHSTTGSSKSSFVDEDMMMEEDGDIPMMTTTTATAVPTTTTTTPYYNTSTYNTTRQVSPTNHDQTYNNNPNHFSSSNSSVSSNNGGGSTTKLQQQARNRRRQRKQEQQQSMITMNYGSEAQSSVLPHNNSGMTVQTDNYSTAYNQQQNDELGKGGVGPTVITPREHETTQIQQQEDPSFDHYQQPTYNNNTYEDSNQYYPQQERNPAIVPLSPPPISSTAYVEQPAQPQPADPQIPTYSTMSHYEEQPPSLAPPTNYYKQEGAPSTDYYTQQQPLPQSNGYNNNAFAYDQGQDPSFPQQSYYQNEDPTMTMPTQPAADPTLSSATNTVASSPTTPYGYHHLHEHRSMESTPESRLGSGLATSSEAYPPQADGAAYHPSLQPPMLHNAPLPYANNHDHHVIHAATNDDDDNDSLFLTDNEGGDDDNDDNPKTATAAAKPKKKYSYNFEDPGQDKVLSSKGKKKKKPAAAGSSRSRRMQAAAAYQQSQGTISSLSDHEGGYSGAGASGGGSRSLRRRQQLMSSHRQRRAAAQQQHPTEDDSSIDDPQPAPNRKKKTVSFSGARNTLYEYSDNEEDGTVDDTLGDGDDETRGDEDTLETGSQYSKDQHNDGYSVGSQTLNSEYTKSYESEVEDALKDFFMIGDGRKSKPGRRKRSEGPVVKKMIQKGQIRKSADQRHKTSLAHVNPYRTDRQNDHKRPPRASSRYHHQRNDDEDDQDDESTLEDANVKKNAASKQQGRNNAVATTKSRSKDEHDDDPTIETEDDPTFDEGDEEEASRRMVESRASGAQSAAASAYTFGEDDDDETESMVSGLTNDKSAYEKKMAALELEEAAKKQQQDDNEKNTSKKDAKDKTSAAATTTDASVMDTLTALFHSAVHSCGLGSGGAFPPSEVEVSPQKNGGSDADKTTETNTNASTSSTPDNDNLLTQVQTQMFVMGVQCQEWLEQKTGCAVELWEKEEGAVAVGSKVGGTSQEETNSKGTTMSDAAEPDPEELEQGLLASVQAAAATFHRLQNKVFDDSYDIDVTTDVEFVVVSASLPLGVLFEENAGGCFISKIFPGGATEFASVVKVGDQLTAIDGHSAVHQTVPQICSRMSTSPNPSHIELTFVRYIGPVHALPEDEVLRRQRLEEIQNTREEQMMDMSYAASSVGDMSSVGEQFWTKKKAGPPIDLKKLSEARALELRQQKAITTSDNADGVEVSNNNNQAAAPTTTKPPSSSLSSFLSSPSKKKPPTATTSILKTSASPSKATTAKKRMSSLFKPKQLSTNTPTPRSSSNTPTRSVATTNSNSQAKKKSGGIKGLFKGGNGSSTK